MRKFVMMKTLYNNPIVRQRADPWVYKHTDGYYYFTGSVPGYQVIELRRAKSLNELEHAASLIVWQAHEEGPMSELIWHLKSIISMENGIFTLLQAIIKLYVMNLIITACSYLKISI